MLIRFNDRNKEPVFIETTHISMVQASDGGATIHFLAGDYFEVSDSVERVVEIVNHGL